MLTKVHKMKEYRPINVLFFLLFTCLLLIPVVFFAPKDGYTILGFNVRFLTWEKLINPVIQEHKDLSFLANVNVNDIEDHEFINTKDSLSSSLGMPSKKGVLAVSSQTQIHMNSESKRTLFEFFEELSKATKKRNKINVCHYGDSQIEGDRMTAFIRQRLQTQFGGAGPGLIPVINVYNTISFRHNYSSNFKRKIIFGKENVTNGCSSDLKKATNLVLKVLKKEGFGQSKLSYEVQNIFHNFYFMLA